MTEKQELQEFRKLEKKLRYHTWHAMEDFNMIENGDKVMVCLSGGKDSYTMLEILLHFEKYTDIDFSIVAVNLDQKQPGFPEEILPNFFKEKGVDFRIIERDTYSIVKEKTPEGKSTCSLCSRLRRGTLYEHAAKLGCNKIALGHHKEDIIETFFLNLFFSGKLEAMPPKYKTDDKQFTVIRPLAYCPEEEIETYSKALNHPIIPCNLCGSQPNLQRQVIKGMINTWEQKYPNRKAIIFNALTNVSPTHLMDQDLYDFKNLKSLLGNDDELVGENIEKFF
jgi:tRNA 2-thiocytidine biosynthesis protein TtcA